MNNEEKRAACECGQASVALTLLLGLQGQIRAARAYAPLDLDVKSQVIKDTMIVLEVVEKDCFGGEESRKLRNAIEREQYDEAIAALDEELDHCAHVVLNAAP